MIGFNHKKAVQALVYFANKEGNTINKMKVFKLIWLSDRLHLRKYGRPLLNDVYFALPKGPIPSSTKDLADGSDFLSEEERSLRESFLENPDRYSIKSKEDAMLSVFSKTDVEIMDAIYGSFGAKNEFELSDISHEYPEWKKFESSFINSSRFEMSYNDFFENPAADPFSSIFSQSEELLSLNKEIFLEDQIIGNLK